MTELLEHGDVHGSYGSRSQAVMATAVAAASAAWTFDQWRAALDRGAHELAQWSTHARRKHGGLRPRSSGDTERRLRTTWRRANARARLRPPTADSSSVRGELAAIRADVDAHPDSWSGAGGVTDHAVLQCLLTVAWDACRLTISASTRQLSEAANVSHGTVSVALQRLAATGWIRLERAADGPKPAVWRLLSPLPHDERPSDAAGVEDLLDQLPPRPVSFHDSTRAHDVFAHTVHRGLGRVAARIFDALDDGAHGGLAVEEIALLTGLHRQTVRRHLVALQAAGLAAAGRNGKTWARSLTAGDPASLPRALDQAADLLGCRGVTAFRRERHLVQREAYVTWWTDFHARRGWAVQRGLYRPDQPQLAAPHAA